MKTWLWTTEEKSWLKDVLHIYEDNLYDLTAYRCWGGLHFRKAKAIDHCLGSLKICKLFSAERNARRFYTMTKIAEFPTGCLTPIPRSLLGLFTNAAPSYYVMEEMGKCLALGAYVWIEKAPLISPALRSPFETVGKALDCGQGAITRKEHEKELEFTVSFDCGRKARE